ncbi:Glycosyltransferase involved in cell wall bisynthesis [Filimonas lacunae]|uniref:Glycosyltransferase involved in cell wall bisynthesis n=1 Tax=Filimonas lacunae TaxID=477680 RepID=A0A173MDI0_9BACT|nr:glycosyltransferase [Filimonas lacunae]BAV05577.1 glycosyl transferase, group 1 [Filimonas lacunae]SIT29315.1 Glycosyltransferase involved in cell wall bisynthesis [Filimonas lacunae]
MKAVRLIFRKPFPTAYSIEYLFNQLHKEFIQTGIPVKGETLPHYSKGLLPRLKNLLSLFKHKNEIVHVTGDVHYALLGALRSKRMLTMHDVAFIGRTKGIARLIYKWLWVKIPVALAHKVVVISEEVKTDLLEHVTIKPGKLAVVTNFIDDIYQPVERKFNAEKPRILQIGTAYNKNVNRLIRALENLPVTLVIIGKHNSEIKELLLQCKIDYIWLSGLTLQEVHAEYLKADILTYVSLKEGFGMPILEAQSTGLPLVTSNCSAMPDVAGQGAVFVDPYNVDSIRSGIVTVIKDNALREKNTSLAYLNVRRYSRERVVADYMEIYKELSA